MLIDVAIVVILLYYHNYNCTGFSVEFYKIPAYKNFHMLVKLIITTRKVVPPDHCNSVVDNKAAGKCIDSMPELS